MADRPLRTRIKFCGLTRPEDVAEAVRVGADAIGFVLDPRSRRYLEPARAAQLRAQLPAFVQAVALFRDADAAAVQRAIRQLQPDLLQFHGEESAEFCSSFGQRYIKAVAMAGAVNPLAVQAEHAAACGLLLDGHAPGQLGGAGQSFDWSQVPSGLGHWVLAGGLDADNVGHAITMARPHAVDVSSGIESAPGIKCAARMLAFIRAVRRADVSAES